MDLLLMADTCYCTLQQRFCFQQGLSLEEMDVDEDILDYLIISATERNISSDPEFAEKVFFYSSRFLGFLSILPCNYRLKFGNVVKKTG